MAKSATPVLCLLAVVALLYMTHGANAATCKTNGGSPSQNDANGVVNYIQSLGHQGCCQDRCSGDYCTQLAVSGGARARMCGACNKCVFCSTAGNALGTIAVQCIQNGRVGGSAFSEGYEFQITGNSNDVVSQAMQ